MSHHNYQMGGVHNGASIDPNAINYGSSYQNTYGIHGSTPAAFSNGGAMLDDDDLLDSLNQADQPPGLPGQDYNGMNEANNNYGQEIYGSHHSVALNQAQINGYSNTPDGDPIQSPFIHNGFNQYRGVPNTFAGALHTPLSYASSPLANGGIPNDINGQDYLKARASMSQAMQRKTSNQRSPLPSKSAAIGGMSQEGFPIRTNSAQHEKSHAGHFMQTPNSMGSFASGGFSSPLNAAHVHNAPGITEAFMKGGVSLPVKMPPANPVSSQEAKRKRRRESHNLVERRRRDNINERIQDLSKLVPAHRLEDEKIRKAIQNGTPLSPSLNSISSPGQATSALAGPGARRATSAGTAGNITTGLPLDEKDKGPNKGDILNGAVSWTRDLMWMLHLKLQQQEELINTIIEMGGSVPFEFSDDERRMQTELLEAFAMNEANPDGGKPATFSYSRTAGTGLRVPQHTDYKGEPLDSNGNPTGNHVSISPDADGNGVGGNDLLDSGEFLDYDDEGSGKFDFKEEDEYGMDLTQ
ncbi:Microphthalmia-associated transcription factor [Coniochaeta hoffmannii]|uniref:Microphthalmia-associated transcription factor n=1 Tax=Coniochaeta hoffmannii TaxID=91930 RepID=A0AA38RQQ9_9PEZI|nr:Microphthalmia-associated transcription factor [Coniochaeta hoffmannii]